MSNFQWNIGARGCNFGKPGPLVHFVEMFYKKGYEEKLAESIRGSQQNILSGC
jgi:hypothetical protein